MTPQDRNYVNAGREGLTTREKIEIIQKDDPRSVHYRGSNPENRANRRAYQKAIGNLQRGRVVAPWARMGYSRG